MTQINLPRMKTYNSYNYEVLHELHAIGLLSTEEREIGINAVGDVNQLYNKVIRRVNQKIKHGIPIGRNTEVITK